METHLIVARYNEDISWLSQVSSSITLKLYNKGAQLFLHQHEILQRPDTQVTNLPNMGRESDTYLRYIIENYTQLPEVCVFIQADYRAHYDKPISFIDSMLNHAKTYEYSINTLHIFEDTDMTWGRNWNKDWDGYKDNWFLHNNYQNGYHITFGDWFEKLMGRDFPTKVHVMPWGIFAVSRNRILSRPVEFYEQLLQVLRHVDPIEGHFMERSWYYVFNCDTI